MDIDQKTSDLPHQLETAFPLEAPTLAKRLMAGSRVEGAGAPPTVIVAAVAVATAAADAHIANCSTTVGLVCLHGFSTSLGGFIQALLTDPIPEDVTTTRRMIIVHTPFCILLSSPFYI